MLRTAFGPPTLHSIAGCATRPRCTAQDDPINIQYTARAKAIRMRIWPGFHPRSDDVMMMSVGQTLSRRIVKSRGPGHSPARPAIPGTCRLNRGLRVETRPSKLIRGGNKVFEMSFAHLRLTDSAICAHLLTLSRGTDEPLARRVRLPR
jgi:hypothetical protein